jgi:hypothetical protein
VSTIAVLCVRDVREFRGEDEPQQPSVPVPA